jgi:hypothetical protein
MTSDAICPCCNLLSFNLFCIDDGGAANGHGVAKAVPMKTVAPRHATCSS